MAIICYIVSIFVGFYWVSYEHYDDLVLYALAVTTLGYLMLGLIFTYRYRRWMNLTGSYFICVPYIFFTRKFATT